MKRIRLVFLCLLITQGVYSQKRTYLPDYAGSVRYTMNPVISLSAYTPTLSTREETLIKMKMESVQRALRANPELSPPNGIEVILQASLPEPPSDQDWLSLVRITLGMKIYPWFEEKGETGYQCAKCIKTVNLYFNQPEKLYQRKGLNSKGVIKDDNGLMLFPEPLKIAEQNECPVYDNGIIVVALPGNPLWVPVSVDEYNKALIRSLEFRMLQKPKLKKELTMEIARINDEIAGFTEMQLKSPAWFGDKHGAWYEATGPDSRPLVRMNPAYFDNTKARISVQLIILESDLIGQGENKSPYLTDPQHIYESEQTIKILQKMDFAGLRKFMN